MSKRFFEVVAIEKLKQVEALDLKTNKMVKYDRWSVRESSGKQATGFDSSFCIVAVPAGQSCPVAVGQIAEAQWRTVTLADGKSEGENWYWIRTYANDAELTKARVAKAKRDIMADETKFANLVYHQQLAELSKQMSKAIPEGVLTGA